MAATQAKPDIHGMVIDKRWLLQEFTEAQAEMEPDPYTTIEQLHAMMLTDGIRPEDNSFSRDILRARYPEEYDAEDVQAKE